MHRQRRAYLALNLVGGPAVLGSYALSAAAFPALTSALWGDLPLAIRPAYTAMMFVAAAGYLSFAGVLFWRVDPAELRWFNRCTAAILLASALWMPLSVAALAGPQPALVPVIWIDLWTTALASLGLLWGLTRLPVSYGRARVLAIAGALAFCVQTVVLDASIWPWFFHVRPAP